MPHERMRSLRWAWEVLTALESNLFGESMWVERAARLARSFPSPSELEHLVEAPATSPATTFAATLNETRELFEEILASNGKSSALRNDLRYTLRHFPSEGVAKAIVSAAALGSLGEWLAEDRDD